MPVNGNSLISNVRIVFEKAMKAFGFPNENRIAVAVSGGADSMALCRLIFDYTQKNGMNMIAFTVNHGLRQNSSQESKQVADWMKHLGIRHRILEWHGEKPESGIEKKARDVRYGLLFEACREEGCTELFLGHHRQDQAETFLIRQAKKSGDMGLAGMSAVREFAFGRMLRPLLGIASSDLREFNRSVGQEWVEDPTNITDDFERGRLRLRLSEQDFEEAFQKSLFYAQKRVELEGEINAFIADNIMVSEAGYVTFSCDAFNRASESAAILCLGEILRAVANKPYPPQSESLSRILQVIALGEFRGMTLGGCQIAPLAKRRVLIWREFKDLPDPLIITEKKLFYWDRFAFSLSEPLGFPITVRPLENALKHKGVFPKRVFSSLPAIFDNEGLFIVPHLGYKRTGTDCRVRFAPIFPLCRKEQWMCPVLL